MVFTEKDVGKLVQYWADGWYAGEIVEVLPRKKIVRIRPLSAYKSAQKDSKKFSFEDVKLV